MRSIFYLFVGLLLYTTYTVRAQNSSDSFRIMLHDGSSSTLPIGDIRNILFTTDGQMQVVMTNDDQNYPLLLVRNIVFTTATQLIEPEQAVNPSLVLFPNPVVDQLSLRFEHDNVSTVLIQIFDLSGKMVIGKTVTSLDLATGIDISVSQLPAGLYLCRVQIGKQLLTSKFIKS
jgi:hypothetical protein